MIFPLQIKYFTFNRTEIECTPIVIKLAYTLAIHDVCYILSLFRIASTFFLSISKSIPDQIKPGQTNTVRQPASQPVTQIQK